jgi:uncharacterized protein YacL
MGKTKYETYSISANAAILSVIHTVYGAFISYLFYFVFDEFNEKWEKRSLLYKLADVTIEIMAIAVFGYWAAVLTQYFSPIFPMSNANEAAVDNWVSGIFFVLALFLFMDSLTHKLKYLQAHIFEDIFSNLLPKYGSIVDLTLSYTPTTKEEREKAKMKTEKIIHLPNV